MKKLFIFLLLGIFMINFVSSWEFDNVKSYDESIKTITIKNSFLGLPLDKVAEIELKTPLNFKVPRGYQKVAEFEIRNFDDYTNALKELRLYDLKDNNKEFLRSFDYKYKTYVNISIDDYENVIIGNTKNGTKIYGRQLVGNHLELREKWINLNSDNFKKNDILTIGIFTEVKKGDVVEWIPTFYGKEITEWAVWTESLNTNLVAYYRLNGSAIEEVNGYNGTNVSAGYGPGLIGEALTSGYITVADENDFDFPGAFSISMWYNSTFAGDANLLAHDSQISTGEWFIRQDSGGTGVYWFYIDDVIILTSSTNFDDGDWHHIVITRDSSNNMVMYVDNVSEDTATDSTDLSSVNVFLINSWSGGALGGRGDADEIGIWKNRDLSVSEVEQLFNNRSGITWTDSFGPIITLNSPIDTYNSTNQTINFNGTVNSPDGIINTSLILDGVYNETNSSGVNDTDYLFTKILSEGNYNWTYESCNIDRCTTPTVRTFTIDTTLPQINISYPVNQNFSYLVNLNNITLNTTITDTNLDTCWYEYNSTNTTFSCSSGVLSENNLTINNESTIIVWANDTLGQENSSTSNWNYDLFDFNNYTFNTIITESSLTTFIGNFQTGIAIISTFLEYNNTNYSVSIDSLGGNRYTLTSTLTTPSIDSDTNITWFFWVNNINATSQNQTVQSIKLDNCSSYSNYIINYTLVDELTQTEISNANSSIESLINLRTINGKNIIQFNQTFTGDSTPLICSEIQLNETGLRIWEQSRYGSDDYVFEQHNIQNVTMTSLPNNIILRDLPSISATTFRITYKSATFLAIPDAVIDIQRKYIGEGVFKSVESPITDANGEVSASLDLDAGVYRIVVSKDGTTLSTFENPAVACDNILTGDCTINLNEQQTINLINNYDIINNFNFGLTQDNRTITLTFEIPNGESKLVNLFVNQSTILGNKTSCNQTLLATSGQIQCVIDDTLGDVFTDIRVSSDDVLITTAFTMVYEDRSQYFGTDNIVLTFFLVLSLVLLFISDPIAVLIGIVIGLISSSLMLFLNSGSVFGTTSVLLYLIVIIIIIIVKISVRQNR